MARAKRSDRPSDTRATPGGGTLYVVATPIGNLEDLTPRASRILREVSVIAAEDTRRLRALAGADGFRARLLSIPAPREAERISTVMAHLGAGRAVALVTDAGTPIVSDPGARLVSAARAAGFRVVPIPGASAVAAALAAAGLGGAGFLFLGFIPTHGGSRRQALEEIARSPRTVVLFEAPHRLARTLRDLCTTCGGQRLAVIARELTKVHEEIVGGPLEDLAARLPDAIRGEVTLLVEGATQGAGAPPSLAARPPDESLEAVVEQLMRGGMSAPQASREAARRLGCDRRAAYRVAISLQAKSPPDGPEDQ